MNVELRIERLVLTGLQLPPGGRAAVSAALGRELTALIQAGGLSPALLGGGSAPALTAALDPSARTASGSRLGRELARSVYTCLGGTRS